MSKFYISEYKTVSKWGFDRGERGFNWPEQRWFESRKERDFFFEDNFYSTDWYRSCPTKDKEYIKDETQLLLYRKDYIWELCFDSRSWVKGMRNTIKTTKENEKFVVKDPRNVAYTYNDPKAAWERMKKILPYPSKIYSVVCD